MKSNLIIFAVIIIIFVGLALSFRKKPTYNRVPRKIWTYWDNPDKLPKTVKMCMKSWAKYNPDYEITLLTKKNFFSYINIPAEVSSHPNFNDNPARFSDLVRIFALKEQGGIWIDPSTLLKAPLDDWLFPKYAEFAGFYTGSLETTPRIQTWFLACNKGSQFIQKWLDELLQTASYPTSQTYIETRIRHLKIDGEPTPAETALQKVLQIDKYPLDTLILHKAEDGPFKYLADAKWNSEKALALACRNKKYQFPIMNIRGVDRQVLEEHIEFDLSPERCEWI